MRNCVTQSHFLLNHCTLYKNKSLLDQHHRFVVQSWSDRIPQRKWMCWYAVGRTGMSSLQLFSKSHVFLRASLEPDVKCDTVVTDYMLFALWRNQAAHLKRVTVLNWMTRSRNYKKEKTLASSYIKPLLWKKNKQTNKPTYIPICNYIPNLKQTKLIRE